MQFIIDARSKLMFFSGTQSLKNWRKKLAKSNEFLVKTDIFSLSGYVAIIIQDFVILLINVKAFKASNSYKKSS